MITYEEVVSEIWSLPDTSIIELDSKISEIIRRRETTEELEVARLLETLLPGVRRDLQDKINIEIKTNHNPKFIFSESSDNRLIGSGNIGKSTLFSNLADRAFWLMSECNRINRSKGRGDIFEYTNLTIKSLIEIKRPAKTEEDFNLFINGMYKIFYEGAGSGSLRIPEKFFIIFENGSPKVTNGNKERIDDFILFHIKHLRSNFDHNTELDEDPDKKDRLIASSCTKYTGKTTIIGLSPKEFLNSQERLLNDIVAFLEELEKEVNY